MSPSCSSALGVSGRLSISDIILERDDFLTSSALKLGLLPSVHLKCIQSDFRLKKTRPIRARVQFPATAEYFKGFFPG